LLSDYWRLTDDDGFVRDRWQRVLAALDWIDQFGDRDKDGYVEYATRSSEGLGNQCWRDSWDGIQFHDGRIPFLPITAADIQGYVYDAKLWAAELAERIMGDTTLADRLEREGEELLTRFNNDFWSEERGGYYVVGLDGDKQPRDREVHLDPRVPDEIGRIQIRNMPAFGARWDVEANGTRGFVRLAR
jgi:glycogen debranching enzyme